MKKYRNKKTPGLFIALYGINNIGKSTHAKLLVERLKKAGHKAIYIKYPIYDLKPTGPLLNKILRESKVQKISEEELQLWFVLNRYHFQPTLQKYLEQGTIVVAEDYCATGIAWGTAKGASFTELVAMNKFLVQEDVAILFEGKRDTRAQEKGHLHEENQQLIAKTTVVLKKLAKKYQWERVKVAPTITKTADILWKLVAQRI